MAAVTLSAACVGWLLGTVRPGLGFADGTPASPSTSASLPPPVPPSADVADAGPSSGIEAGGPPGPETREPGLHDALVRENRELAARAAALEEENLELQREMLALDLRLVALDDGLSSDRRRFDGREPSSVAEPIELGDIAPVPAPAPASPLPVAPPTQASALADAGPALEEVDPFLPEAYDELVTGVDPDTGLPVPLEGEPLVADLVASAAPVAASYGDLGEGALVFGPDDAAIEESALR